jgi:predicted ATPase/class 3 adenylate cyclase/GAF domain-containing protein
MPSFEGYEKLEKIAEGNDRVIYTALRVSDGTPVVLKTLRSQHPTVDMIALMYHEYEVAKEINFPGIIRTYDLIDQQNHYALVQENMGGISLRQYLKENLLTDISLFLKLAIQMTKIIGHLHQLHIIHKDIKPNNFIIDPFTLTVKITDFNYSSKLIHETQDIVPPAKLEGTLAYMAPEQTGRMNMHIDYRADFYALGISFYEMLSGKLPYDYSDALELLHAHLANPIPTVANPELHIPTVIVEIIQKLMAKNPNDRYQSAIGLQFDLEHCLELSEETGIIEPFPLGQQDIQDRLNLSQKLYGREREAQVLLKAYERISQGSVEALMVSGYSGIGKTMLINEVHKPMVQHRGYFVHGKFDQLQRDKPYTAITEAFNHLARLILAEPEPRFDTMKKSILAAMGSVGQVMIDLAPDIALVIGTQPLLEQLPPKETENRMKIFFKQFLHVVASKDHPLVIFIDDLQWVDSGSLSLLEEIIMDEEMTHLLFIGAYRENEVDANHLLKKFIQHVEEKKKQIQSLSLPPLSVENFSALFQDSFHRDAAAVSAFAELVHTRTKGNPFFCKQVLNLLYREGFLYFNYDRHHWDWDLAKISSLAITDNVVDLMLDKLAELPVDTQSLLKYAACVGNQFTLDMLMLVSDQSADEIGMGLWPALQQELVITPNLGYKRVDAVHNENLAEQLSKNVVYQFVHDRVQQAAYQSISEENKAKIHLNIARILIQKEPVASKKERLFEVVDHFNQAHALLSKEERKEVANLNYLAGVQAKNANAYKPMLNYLTAALLLIDETSWETDYRLSFNINRDYLLALYLLHKVQEAEEFNRTLLKRAKTKLDQAQLYRIQIMSAVEQEDKIKVLNTARLALGLLDVNLVLDPNPIQMMVKLARVRWKMRNFISSHVADNLPPLTNPEMEMVFDIFTEIYFTAYEKGTTPFVYLVLSAVELQLVYGRPRSAGMWLLAYAITIVNIYKDIDLAIEYSDIAEKFALATPDKYSVSISHICRGHLINHWSRHVSESIEYIEKGLQEARESGNVLEYSLGSIIYSFAQSAGAKSLSKVVESLENVYKDLATRGMEGMSVLLESIYVNYKTLGDGINVNSDRFVYLENKILSSKSLLEYGTGQKYLSFYYFFQEQFDKSIESHFGWYTVEETIRYELFVAEVKAINALALMRLPTANSSLKKKYQKRIRQLMKDVAWAAKVSPDNYLHHHLFLKAYESQTNKKYAEALIQFNQAIENAQNGDFYLWTALGYELIGDLFIEMNQKNLAIYSFRDARYYYSRYGMLAKVKSLERRFPDCVVEERSLLSPKTEDLSLSNTTSGTTSSATLDFMSVIKASQAISGEIMLEKLFQKMLHVLLENAGATKVILLEPRKNVWVEAASLTISEGRDEFKMLNVNSTESDDLPQAVVQYAIRSREPLVLHHGDADDKFKQDPYIVRTQPKSILCLPIMQQDMVLGIIYLENNLTTNAFTQDRVTVLQTLASQIAISLQNSHYLEHMEHLYHSTERFVPKKFLEIIKRENIEDVGLGDSAKREITVLFNDIRSFTTLTENRTPEEAFAFINRYWKFMAPIIRKYDGYIDHYQGDAILAIFANKPQDAVLAAINMMKALSDFNKVQAEHHDVAIGMGIGICTGPAMLGIIGEEERQVSGLISDVANTAARVEGLNTFYGSRILLSDATARDLPVNLRTLFRKVDKVRLKGKTQVTEIFEYIEWQDSLKVSLAEYLELFSKAFNTYEKGHFKEAENLFAKCLALYENDKAAQSLQQRCLEFMHSKAPSDWDGAYTLTRK